MKLLIPNVGELELQTLILDLNGTIAIRGELVVGVKEKINTLKNKGLRIILFSGDTRGNGKKIAEDLGIELIITSSGKDKELAAKQCNPETAVTIGNGLIDVELFRTVTLSIAVLQAEGLHTSCLNAATIVVPSVLDALDLLIDEISLIATLRK